MQILSFYHSTANAAAFASIDVAFTTTLATTSPTPEDQATFANFITGLLDALKTLIPIAQVSDSQLAVVLLKVENYKCIQEYLSFFQTSLYKMSVQLNYISNQYASIEAYQKAAKDSVKDFTKNLAIVSKNSKANQDAGKRILNDVASKMYADQKIVGDKVQRDLNANPSPSQTLAASAASTKIDVFYNKFAASIVTLNAGFTASLAAQYTFMLGIESTLKDSEVLLVQTQVTNVAKQLFKNTNGAGQTCLKTMSSQFATMFTNYQTAQAACFEDYNTYVLFTTEFVKVLLSTAKCQADASINTFPACLKQVSKKTSKAYNDAMYNTCLATVSCESLPKKYLIKEFRTKIYLNSRLLDFWSPHMMLDLEQLLLLQLLK